MRALRCALHLYGYDDSLFIDPFASASVAAAAAVVFAA